MYILGQMVTKDHDQGTRNEKENRPGMECIL